MLNQLFDVQMQSGQRVYLPGRQKYDEDKKKIDRFIERNNFENNRDYHYSREYIEEEEENEDDIELVIKFLVHE